MTHKISHLILPKISCYATYLATLFCLSLSFSDFDFNISLLSYFPRQGVHKGKISSPGVSPRASGGEDNSREGGEEEEEDEGGDSTVQPGDVMKLQLEVLEGETILSLTMRVGSTLACSSVCQSTIQSDLLLISFGSHMHLLCQSSTARFTTLEANKIGGFQVGHIDYCHYLLSFIRMHKLLMQVMHKFLCLFL